MGFIADIAEWIAGVIQSVIKVIAGVIEWIGTKVLPALAAVIGGVVFGVAIISIFAPAVAPLIFSTIVSSVAKIGSLVIKLGSFVIHNIGTAINTITTTFGNILNAIHFTELLQIHQIAWILSEDYRAIMTKVFDAISEVSEEMFGDSLSLHLIFQNARTLIFNTSSLFGYSFDLAEVTWLNTFDEFLVTFNNRAETYMKNPEQLFFDIDNYIVKPAQDNASKFQQSMILSLQGVLETTNTVVGSVVKVRTDLDNVVSSMPSKIQDQVRPMVDPWFERVDHFVYDIYEPKMAELGIQIEESQTQQRENRNRLDFIDWSLEFPSRQFKKIDTMDPETRTQEEIDLEEISTRPFRAGTEELISEAEADYARHQKIEALLKEEIEAPEILELEAEEIETVPMKSSVKRQSPFVGDY